MTDQQMADIREVAHALNRTGDPDLTAEATRLYCLLIEEQNARLHATIKAQGLAED